MSKPIVSIVGRPNVGKSTLFNRIVRRREAIVDDTPGITRDRKHADAEWEGLPFVVVDTGGYIPKSQDIIEAGVTKQVQHAIEEADLVLFVVDVMTGITDVDGHVADLLRKSNKACVLAVNKVDGEKREPDAAGFIRLGLGEPVVISAITGRNIGDLLSHVVKKLDRPQENGNPADGDNVVKLAVVGKPNVGKSTFVNAILGEERLLVTEIPGTTRDSVDVNIRYNDHSLLLIDTAGMRRRSRVTESAEYYSVLRAHRVLERCDVACVFVDVEEGITQQDMRVLKEAIDTKKGTLLVANKWDLLKGDEEKIQRWYEQRDRRLGGMTFVPVLSVSCKTGLRVRKILERAWLIAEERKKRISSPELNRLLTELNRKYQPPAVRGKRVRVLYGSQVSTAPPRFVFFSNFPNLVKENYQRFLENSIRDHFGFEGVPLSLAFKKK
jgi:GTP-binding protein